jgi:hypothetical protein
MASHPTSEPVHYYDTTQHAIACGVRGFAEPSTKYPRSVTCAECIRVLATEPQEHATTDAAV